MDEAEYGKCPSLGRVAGRVEGAVFGERLRLEFKLCPQEGIYGRYAVPNNTARVLG